MAWTSSTMADYKARLYLGLDPTSYESTRQFCDACDTEVVEFKFNL